jgi:hypothetical protein
MAQIAWTTPAGDLGTYPELTEFSFQLEAENPLTSALTFTVISGDLPPGIQLYTSGLLYGIPNIIDPGEPVARKYRFTIRAKNFNNQIADRSFSLSINGIAPPTLNTATESLGIYFNSDYVNIQLAFTETNPGTALQWSVSNGLLPPGLTLSQQGTITGFAEAPPAGGPAGTASYDIGRYDEFTWDFEGATINRVYRFAVRIFDGILSAEKYYTLTILAKSYFRTDNILITADSTVFTTDQDGYEYPTITTLPGELEPVRGDRNYAFQFKAYYPNTNVPVYWKIVGTGPHVFDQGAPPVPDEQGNVYELATYDEKAFDQSNLSLPPGLQLDRETGWLTGGIGTVTARKSSYTFIVVAYVEIPVSETEVSLRESTPIQFSIDILSDIDNFITWTTDTDLGIIDNGDLSTLYIEAVSNRDDQLFYSINSGEYSRLPQGLQLLPSGIISGRTSFDFFSMDRSSFQVTMDDGTTTWDTKYRFTVLAQDATGFVFDTKEFTLTVRNVNIKPFENLYMKALLPKDLRERFRTTVNNPSLIPSSIVYRPDDPYFGLARDLKFLAVPGLRASTFSQYIEALVLYHKNKKVKFGEIKLAVAKDDNLNTKYEVIYIEVLDYNDLAAERASTNLSRQAQFRRITDTGSINTEQVETEDFGQLFAGRSTSQDFGEVDTALSTATQNVSFSNSFGNMTGELIDNIGYEYQGAIPDWMSTIQPDTGQPLGFVRAVVLAYIKPGEGKKALFRYSKELESSGFGILALVNQYSFEADRYLLDRALTINYDSASERFTRAVTTTFDRIPSIGVVDTGPWVRKESNTLNNLQAVDFGDGELIAVGANSTIITSTSGELWNTVPQLINLGYSAGVITAANVGATQFNFAYGTRFSLGDELLNQGEYQSAQSSYITSIEYYVRLSTPVVGEIPQGTALEFIRFDGTTFTNNTTAFVSNATSLIYFDDISTIDRGFGVRIAGIDVENRANVIIKNASTNELQLSRPLTNLIPAGTQITFDDLNGNIVSLITSTTAANASSNLTFSTSTTNVKIGSFATISNIAQGVFVQALNTNIAVTESSLVSIPLGTQLFFSSVITANVVAGDTTINLSSTDRIGIGTSVFGDSVTSETVSTRAFWPALPTPGTSLTLSVLTSDIIGVTPFVGMTVTAPGLPADSRISSVTTFGANTIIGLNFANTVVAGNPVSTTITVAGVTGPVAPNIDINQTYIGVASNINLAINDYIISSNIALEDNVRILSVLANGGVIIDNTDSNIVLSSGETVYFIKSVPIQFATATVVPEGTVVSSKTATSITLSSPVQSNVNIGEDQLLNFGLSEIDLNFVLYNDGWYAVGTKGTVLQRDADGVWSQGYATAFGDLYGLAVGPGPVYVVIGNEGLIARSTDFVTWTRQSTPSITDYRSIEYHNNYWVIVGDNGTVLVSLDNALTWSIDNTITTKNIYSVKYLNNNWIAVGERGLVMISQDALSWNVYYAGVSFTLRDVAYVRNQYIAVGDKGIILESIDGTSWSTRLSYQTDNILSIANSSRSPIVVGSNGLILVESNNFTVDFAIRGVSFEMFNYNTLEDLAALGYPVKENDTLLFAQQEGFDPSVFRGETFQNDGWNAYNEIFDDESPFLAYDSSAYDNITVIPGYVANLLDPTVSNQRAGIWRVALNSNGIAYLVFVRQIQFGQIITALNESNKLVYDPDVPTGGTVPTFRLLNQVNNDSTAATIFDTNSTRFNEPRDQYLSDPNQHDRYLKFPSTDIVS